jgi:hypothetical protein
MKKNLLLFVGAFLTWSSSIYAQDAQRRKCFTMEHLEALKAVDPGLSNRMQAIEEHTAAYTQHHRESNINAPIVTIPVVFHVLYKTAAQNLSDAQCIAQLNQLNLDYAKLNSDTNSVPAVFRGLHNDTKIQFCLAQRDPNGLATTGIVHKSTTANSFSSNDDVKFTSRGGDNAWPSSKYLNIWVCNLGSSLLGYAQFPGGPAATDGVVILYSAVGSMQNPGTASPYDLGRTATHEVGHWLNLLHVWGSGTCGNDQVGDTPTQQTSNFGCPTFPQVTCNNGPNGDMFMNYMDYTDDACMMMFSAGQSTRMQSLFSTGGSRASLLTSNGCQPLQSGSFAFNAVAPASATCGSASAAAFLESTASSTFSTPINLTASGAPSGTSVSFTSNPLTPGNSTSILLNNCAALAPGTYPITITGTAGTAIQTAIVSFVITAGSGPAITTQPVDVVATEGTNAELSVATSATAATYQWQVSTNNGSTFTNLPNSNVAIFSFPVALSMNNYKYRVLITSPCGTSTSNVITLTVNNSSFVYPNPSRNGDFTIAYMYSILNSYQIRKVNISVFDTKGARVMEKNFENVKHGNNLFKLPGSNKLEVGSYVIVIRDAYGKFLASGTVVIADHN